MSLVDAAAKRPWLIWRLGREMGELQAKIHSVSPSAALQVNAPDYWMNRMGSERPEVRELLMAQNPTTSTFVHMDFHPLNLLSDGRHITGIVDWANGSAGDRRADLAYSTVLMRLAPIPPHPLKPMLHLARQVVLRAGRRAYSAIAGWPDKMSPFYAWAAAIFLNEDSERLGREGVWAKASDLKAFEDWIDRHMRTATR